MKNLRKILMALLICVMIVSVFVACNDTPAESPDSTPAGGTPAETPSGTPDETDPPHTHAFGAEWKADGENHWHECECGEKKDVAAHVFGEDMKVAGNIIVYTCTACEQDIAVPYDPTKAVSSYFGASLYGDPEDSMAKYELNAAGMPVRTIHYALVCYAGGGIPYSTFSEVARDTYKYDEKGNIQSIETVIDESAYDIGIYGALGDMYLEKITFTFVNGEDGKPTKAHVSYEGDARPEESLLFAYGEDGRIASVDTVDYGDEDDVISTLLIKDGKIVGYKEGDDTVTITYNSDGNIATVSGLVNVEIEYADGAITRSTLKDDKGESTVLEYSYTDGKLVRSTLTVDEETYTTEYGYDKENRKTSFSISAKVNGKDMVVQLVEISYNASGKAEKLVMKQTETADVWDDVTTMTVVYDEKGRISELVSLVEYADTTELPQKTAVKFTYDDNDNVIKTEMIGYSYDPDKKEYYKAMENVSITTYDSEGRAISTSQISQRYGRDGKVEYSYKNETSTVYNENGKVVTDVSYRYDKESNTFIEYSRCVTEYDKDGNEIRREESYENRRVVYEYKLGINGNYFCSVVTRYHDGIPTYSEEYNEYGDMVKRTHWDDKGQISELWETKFTYDDKGRPATSNRYDNGTLVESCSYGYDEDGHRYVIKRTTHYSDGKLREEVEYNDNEDITLSLYYEKDGTLASKSTYSYVYDDNRNIISRERRDFDVTTGKVIYTYGEEYAIDEEGHRYLKKETECDSEGIVTIREYNAEGEVISLTVKDNNGNVIQSQNIEYTYDETGRVVSSKSYSNGKLVEECFYKLNEWEESYKYQSVEYHEDGSKTVISYDKWKDEIGRVEYDKDGNAVSRSGREYVYNDAGEAIGERYYENNRLSYEYVYGTDKDGYIYNAKEIYYYEDGGKNVMEYDECGNQTRYTEYDSAGNVTWERESVHTYDENGRHIYEKEYVDGKLCYEYEYDYVSEYENKITRKEIRYYEDGGKEITYNDDHGHAVKSVVYDAKGNVVEENTYVNEYDSHGCITLQTAYKNGKLVSVAELYSCEETDYRTVIKRWTGYDEDGSKYIFEYNVYGEIVKETYYDANGNVIKEYSHSYEHDREGNLILEMTYMDGELISEVHRYSIDDGVYCAGTIKKWIEYLDDGAYRVTDYNTYGEQISVVVYDKNGNVIG